MGEGLNRRELLKRGAIAGGALWATPIMHSVGIAQVDSEDTSTACQLTVTVEPQICDEIRPVFHFEVCATGCACYLDQVFLRYEGSNPDIDLPLTDGCHRSTFTLWGGDLDPYDWTFWFVCLNEAGDVIATSEHVTITVTPRDCQP